jgi:hypothetical protein
MDIEALKTAWTSITSKSSSRHDFAPQHPEVFGTGSYGWLIIYLYSQDQHDFRGLTLE